MSAFRNRSPENLGLISKMKGPSKVLPNQLNLRILSQTELIDPKVWGPALWFSLHNGARHYPNNPSNTTMIGMKKFIQGLPYIIPCYDCSEHTKKFINSKTNSDINDSVSSKEKLFEFYVDLHNSVNYKLGKPVLTYYEAKKLYK